MSLVSENQDIKLDKTRLERGKLFANKLWNASRFVLMNLESGPITESIDAEQLRPIDQWVLYHYQQTVEQANQAMERYRFGDLSDGLIDFTWNIFCDWYVEAAKQAFRSENEAWAANTRRILLDVLDGLLRLLHPVMPFITEELWQALPKTKPVPSISLAAYPQAGLLQEAVPAETVQAVELTLEAVKALRNARQQYNVPPSKPVSVMIEAPNDA